MTARRPKAKWKLLMVVVFVVRFLSVHRETRQEKDLKTKRC